MSGFGCDSGTAPSAGLVIGTEFPVTINLLQMHGHLIRYALRSGRRLKEALIKFMKDSLEPAKRGDSIKPGVERKRNSRAPCGMEQKPTKWATAISSRAHGSFWAVARFARLMFFRLVILGFGFAPPQALCFYPLRGF